MERSKTHATGGTGTTTPERRIVSLVAATGTTCALSTDHIRARRVLQALVPGRTSRQISYLMACKWNLKNVRAYVKGTAWRTHRRLSCSITS